MSDDDLLPLDDKDLRAVAGKSGAYTIAQEILSPFIGFLDDASVELLLPRIVLAIKAERGDVTTVGQSVNKPNASRRKATKKGRPDG